MILPPSEAELKRLNLAGFIAELRLPAITSDIEHENSFQRRWGLKTPQEQADRELNDGSAVYTAGWLHLNPLPTANLS